MSESTKRSRKKKEGQEQQVFHDFSFEETQHKKMNSRPHTYQIKGAKTGSMQTFTQKQNHNDQAFPIFHWQAYKKKTKNSSRKRKTPSSADSDSEDERNFSFQMENSSSSTVVLPDQQQQQVMSSNLMHQFQQQQQQGMPVLVGSGGSGGSGVVDSLISSSLQQSMKNNMFMEDRHQLKQQQQQQPMEQISNFLFNHNAQQQQAQQQHAQQQHAQQQHSQQQQAQQTTPTTLHTNNNFPPTPQTPQQLPLPTPQQQHQATTTTAAAQSMNDSILLNNSSNNVSIESLALSSLLSKFQLPFQVQCECLECMVKDRENEKLRSENARLKVLLDAQQVETMNLKNKNNQLALGFEQLKSTFSVLVNQKQDN